jgi:FixJ family two-component response regulator
MPNEASPLVYVVDDDPSVRNALRRLLGSVGLQVRTFASARDFLCEDHADVPSCLVLDVRMPGMSGLDLQRELTAAGLAIPIIFITGHGDVPMSVRAMKAGAVDFLPKPFNDQQLLDAIRAALERAAATRAREAELEALRRRLDTVTPREREVLALVVTGMLNKQIAAQLGTAEKTVKVHRARLMAKMEADSLASLVRMADRLGIRARPQH